MSFHCQNWLILKNCRNAGVLNTLTNYCFLTFTRILGQVTSISLPYLSFSSTVLTTRSTSEVTYHTTCASIILASWWWQRSMAATAASWTPSVLSAGRRSWPSTTSTPCSSSRTRDIPLTMASASRGQPYDVFIVITGCVNKKNIWSGEIIMPLNFS